jgi:hypothetical protein
VSRAYRHWLKLMGSVYIIAVNRAVKGNMCLGTLKSWGLIVSIVSSSVFQNFQTCKDSRYVVIQYANTVFRTLIASVERAHLSSYSVHNFQHAVRVVTHRLLHHSKRVEFLPHLPDFCHAILTLSLDLLLNELFLFVKGTSL